MILRNEEFCRDAFGAAEAGRDGGSAGSELREGLVAGMVRARRRARLAIGARMVCCGAALILVAVMSAWRGRESGRLVGSAPTGPSAVDGAVTARAVEVRSRPFGAVVRSAPLSESMIVRSDELNLAVVRSESGSYDLISDEQMFAMLSGWSVALVRVNGLAELEILGP